MKFFLVIVWCMGGNADGECYSSEAVIYDAPPLYCETGAYLKDISVMIATGVPRHGYSFSRVESCVVGTDT